MIRLTPLATRIAAFVVTVTAFAFVTVHPANAVMGCGQFSLPLDGVLLDSSAPVGGPYELVLAAGTYDMIFQSTITSDSGGGAGQWNVILDSGHISPTTTEIVDGDSYIIDVFEGERIEATTSLTIHHVDGQPVVPVCVGFTPVSPSDESPVVYDSTERVLPADTSPAVVEPSTDVAPTGEIQVLAIAADPLGSTPDEVQPPPLTTPDDPALHAVVALAFISSIAAGVLLVIKRRSTGLSSVLLGRIQQPKFRLGSQR